MASGNQWQTQQRRKIKRAHILELFINHALDPVAFPMTASQIKVGEFLMKRSLPELRSVEHTGQVDSKIEVSISIED